MWIRVNSWSLKMVPVESLGMGTVSYLHYIVTMALSRPAAVHCLRVSCWRADRVTWHVIPPVRRWHAAPHQHGQHQHRAGHRQARSLFGHSSSLVPAERPPTQRWQVRGGHSQHPCSAVVSCQHHHRRRYRKNSASRIEAQVVWRDHWFQPAVRLSCEKCCKGLQLPHSRSAPHAQSTDWRCRPDSCVQHCHFQAGLLQCTVEWCTGSDF